MNTNTIQQTTGNTRLNIVTSAPVPMPRPVLQQTHTITKTQCVKLRELIAAREAFNAAKRRMERLQESLGLPRWEGEAGTVSLVCGKRIVAEVQVSFRAPYPVPACWVNKLVAK